MTEATRTERIVAAVLATDGQETTLPTVVQTLAEFDRILDADQDPQTGTDDPMTVARMIVLGMR